MKYKDGSKARGVDKYITTGWINRRGVKYKDGLKARGVGEKGERKGNWIRLMRRMRGKERLGG